MLFWLKWWETCRWMITVKSFRFWMAPWSRAYSWGLVFAGVGRRHRNYAALWVGVRCSRSRHSRCISLPRGRFFSCRWSTSSGLAVVPLSGWEAWTWLPLGGLNEFWGVVCGRRSRVPVLWHFRRRWRSWGTVRSCGSYTIIAIQADEIVYGVIFW